jgi:uncharacterized protein (TIGR03083 family)
MSARATTNEATANDPSNVIPERILPLIESERLRLAALLESLNEHEFVTQSLCPDWTVHHVVAHLTLATRLSLRTLIGPAIRERGNFNQMMSTLARQRAAIIEPAVLVAQFRDHAGSTHHVPGSSPWDRLIDVVVHGQDIARPLGRAFALRSDLVVPLLTPLWSRPFYGCRKRFAGLKLIATDAAWSAGDGTLDIHGPVDDLLLIAAGRVIALDALSGAGVQHLPARLEVSR